MSQSKSLPRCRAATDNPASRHYPGESRYLVQPMSHTFTDEDRQRGGRAAQPVQAAARAHRSLVTYRTTQLVDAIEQGEFGQRLMELSLNAAARLEEGLPDFPLDESIDQYRLSQVLETLFKMYRLETGQSTSNALSATVDQTELSSRRDALLARLQPTEQSTDTPGQ